MKYLKITKKGCMYMKKIFCLLLPVSLSISLFVAPSLYSACTNSKACVCTLTRKICAIEESADATANKVCTIDSKIDVIDVNLNFCCTTVNSKLDCIDTVLEACCFTVNSKLDILLTTQADSPCAPIPLSNADVIGDSIPLNTPGKSYCFTEDIGTSDDPVTITINEHDVTIDLNDHALYGRIIVGDDRAIIRNGKVLTPNNTISQTDPEQN